MKQRLNLRTGRPNTFSLRFWFLLACLFYGAFSSLGADRFDDIEITPITLANGETHHGYREYRILIANRSAKNTHTVTLIFPDKSYNSGNAISRLSRTVTIGPSSSAVVPLWQPPLAINGNNQMRVLTDGDEAGLVNLPDAARHLTGYYGSRYGGSPLPPTAILVSRSLNFDELDRAFNSKGNANDFSAKMATGAPDSATRSGGTPNAWMPDPTKSGPSWLELDYTSPEPAKGVRLYPTRPIPPGTLIIIKGISGTNLFQTNSSPTRTGRFGNHEFLFPLTTEPVKTVRLEFGYSSSGNSVGIDAVELVGATTSAWASDARASSEATTTSTPAAGGAPPTRGLLRSELPVTQWSETWLSYSPYDAVALTDSDLNSLSPAAFAALWSYVECGGNVFVFGAGSVPEAWRSFQKTPVENGECRNIGLGRCFTFGREKVSTLPATTIRIMTDAVDQTARYWQSLPEEESANQIFPVVQNSHVPLRSTMFIMLIFIIAIGPVNLIVLSRTNRRTWLLWTIPAISFFTSLAVFIFSYLHEGITPDTRTSSLTVLDQINRRAVSVGYTAFYCPLTPSQGLFFGPDTEATPLVTRWDYQGGTDREIDWTQGQHLGRGWVSARVPAHFELRKPETRRERLEVENQNGHLTVLNGLGAPIKSLWYADGHSHVYTATNVPAGQRVTLSITAIQLRKDEQLGARLLLEKTGPQADLTDTSSYLQPNTYIAELDANPFLENGLGPKAKSARNKSRAVVFGTIELTVTP